MPRINRSVVKVDIQDVDGQTITDSVQFKLYNQRAGSLNQVFSVPFRGHSVQLKNVPAFPFGLAELFIKPTKYRYKSIFINVPSGKTLDVSETCFVDPGMVSPSFPEYGDLERLKRWKNLISVLGKSDVDQDRWERFDDQLKAGLFNLHAKMQHEHVAKKKPVFAYLERIERFQPERVFAHVAHELYELVRSDHETFHVVSGALHPFPAGWTSVRKEGSFKTFCSAGNLQLTFARNSRGDYMADIDIDDHQGLAHAADVLKHKITGKDTHPFNIHQILKFFQGLDPGYALG